MFETMFPKMLTNEHKASRVLYHIYSRDHSLNRETFFRRWGSERDREQMNKGSGKRDDLPCHYKTHATTKEIFRTIRW